MKTLLAAFCVVILVAGCKNSMGPSSNSNPTTGTISGVIKDAKTNLPIAYPKAALFISIDTPRIVTGDAGGNYHFDTVPPGTYMVAGGADNYVTGLDTITIRAGANTTANFALQLDTSSTPPPPPFTADTLVALYRFSGTAIDSSGNGHNGTLHGGTFVADRFGNPASALQFNGTSGYVSIPDAADLNFGKSSNFSICFWAQGGSNSAIGSYIVHKGTTANNVFTGYEITYNYPAITGYVGTTYGEAYNNSGSIGTDGRWHFIVETFDRSGGISFYFDGIWNNSFTNNSPQTAMQGNLNNTAPLLIGGNGLTSTAFKGTLDDIRIYRGSLTQDEITKLYHENGW